MDHNDLSTCTCIDCTPERWLFEPSASTVYREYLAELTRRHVKLFASDPDTCEGYVSDGPFSCTCDRCVLASEPTQPKVSPEATSRPLWRLKALWSRLTHR